MTARTWTEGDAVAEHDGDRWRLGVVKTVEAGMVGIRFAGGDRIAFRRASSRYLADPDDVPIDERHWLPEVVRDHLVRDEAAKRLAAFAEDLPLDAERDWLHALAAEVAEPIVAEPAEMARAARRLLALTPQPSTTEVTR